MALGQECPHCEEQTFHDEGSFRECGSCGYIGWAWSHAVAEVGRGKGNECWWCERSTLHEVTRLPGGHVLRRCATCNYTAIEPAS